jgi:hypothetical protein
MRFADGFGSLHIGSLVRVEVGADVAAAALALPTGDILELQVQQQSTALCCLLYGTHELRLRTQCGKLHRYQFMVTSYLGDLAEALDEMQDVCDWIWDGTWTEELEDSIMGLLVALDLQFKPIEAMLQQNPMGKTMYSEMVQSRRRLENVFAKAIEGHEPQIVGTMYGAIRAVLSIVSGLNGYMNQNSHLYRCVIAFERARFNAASERKKADYKASLSKLIVAADSYGANASDAESGGFVSRWHSQLRDELVRMREEPNAFLPPFAFHQLRGECGDAVTALKSLVNSFGIVQRSKRIEYHTALKTTATYNEAVAHVSRWTESLVDEWISLVPPTTPSGFVVSAGEPHVRHVFAALQSVLSLGFGYITEGLNDAETSRIVMLFNRQRAVLPLHSPDEFLQDRRRRNRLKEVRRIVRRVTANKKHPRLSLRVNTDFEGALEAFNDHHTDNWVGSSLQGVWKKMVTEQLLFVFELWLIDPEGTEPPKLIAADFGHPHSYGQAYYVTTRFFNKEYRSLQPGFILAFAEAECLRRAGFALWDLGGFNASPMMHYKADVAIDMSRSDFLRRLRECTKVAAVAVAAQGGQLAQAQLNISEAGAAPSAQGDKIPTGTVVADITEEDLWGANEMTDSLERHHSQRDKRQ